MCLPGTDPIKKVSIIPRGVGAIGYTMQMPAEDRYLITRSELLDRMTVLLGGRAAEMSIFHEATTGAADDLQRATEMARAMVTRFGMEPEVGQASYVSERPHYLDLPGLGRQRSEASEETNAKIDEAVRNLVQQAFERATAILRDCVSIHERAARSLLEKETFEEEDLAHIRAEIQELRGLHHAAQ
jgi:cell division protease FtsH